MCCCKTHDSNTLNVSFTIDFQNWELSKRKIFEQNFRTNEIKMGDDKFYYIISIRSITVAVKVTIKVSFTEWLVVGYFSLTKVGRYAARHCMRVYLGVYMFWQFHLDLYDFFILNLRLTRNYFPLTCFHFSKFFKCNFGVLKWFATKAHQKPCNKNSTMDSKIN